MIKVLLVLLMLSCGSDGKHGKDGDSCTIDKVKQELVCDDGTKLALPKDGKDGINGKDGNDGNDGNDGKSAEQNLLDLVNKVKIYEHSVLDIRCNSGKRGTGIKITSVTILTAKHVIDGSSDCAYYDGYTFVGNGGFRFQQGSRDQVQISNVNWNSDGERLAAVPYKTDYQPTLGEGLMLLSLPLDLDSWVQFTFGYVNSTTIDQVGLWEEAFTTDMAAAGGSSGGPVLNSEGELVAIHVGGYNTDGLELNISLPIR